MTDLPHIPVLLGPFLQFYADRKLSIFVDGTLGAGGHSAAILEAHPEITHLVGIDQDPQARALAAQRLAPWKDKVTIVAGNFADISSHLQALGIQGVDGIFLDLGVSSMQLDQGEKGFSFSKEGPLDMRMDPSQPLSAADIVNEFSEGELGRILRDYGEESRWRLIAKTLVSARKQGPITTTQQIASILEPLFPSEAVRRRKKLMHPLTLVFQGLRIAVNGELEVLEKILPEAIASLNPGGRLGVISYHSLEDRIVKNCFRFYAADKYDTSGVGGMFLDKVPEVNLLTRKPVEADDDELAINPRARSAKMRFVE
jgi:16S rRNA (cytosine1402-N4)-methyltransferase